MAHLQPQGLLLLVLFAVISECRGETVSATQEENAVLPCFDSNVKDPSCYRVKLIKYPTDASQMKVIFAWPQTHKSQDAERVKWEADGKEQIKSLFLTKLQKSDEGLYSCEIWQGWDRTHVKNISLKIKECKTLQPVKAAPSTAVNLNCPVNTTSGQPGPRNISWALLKGGNPVSAKGSERVEINGTSLAIQSVSSSDSGWYRCKYMLGQTQRCFDINLLVQVENSIVDTTTAAPTTSEIIQQNYKTSDNKASEEGTSQVFIVAVVASLISGIALIAAVTGLFIYSRRNTLRLTQLTQRRPIGAIETGDYEIVSPTLPPDDPANQRVNSLYQQFDDENLCTFHY